MKITMIGDYPRSSDEVGGGVESVMLYLAKQLCAVADVELQIVTLDRWGLGARRCQIENYNVEYVPSAKIRGPLARYTNIARLAKAVKNSNPDLVHAHIAGHYSRAAILSKLPVVLTLHGIRFLEANLRQGLINQWYRRHVVRFEERRDIKAVSHIISINPFIEETFSQILPSHVTKIANPVADSFFSIPEPDQSLRLLYAGRITPRKDLLTLLQGFAELHKQYPEAELRIAGAPDKPDRDGYLSSIQGFIAEQGLEAAVKFLGNLSEERLHEEYAKAPLFVLSAVLETAPMSIGEAMAAGRIVVTTDAGGCRHMVEDGVSGMVVPVKDSHALGAALLKLAANPDLRQRMSVAARARAHNIFSAKNIAERTVNLYREILRHDRAS